MPDLLMQHGVVVLFAWAFAVQAGVSAPAVPMLLGAGNGPTFAPEILTTTELVAALPKGR
jgi:hypothetical protein